MLQIALAAILLGLIAAPAVAQTDEAGGRGLQATNCLPHLSRAAVSDGARDRFSIDQIWEKSRAPVFETHGYGFTTRAGRFALLNCTDSPSIELQDIYPIGTLVKPLGILSLDPDRPWAANCAPAVEALYDADGRLVSGRLTGNARCPTGDHIYLIVLTEHGHMKLVPQDDVQYLIDGATYFFANSKTPVLLCREGEACPGNQRRIATGDGAEWEVCDAQTCRSETGIDAGHMGIDREGGYAVGAAAGEGTAWGAVARARDDLRRNGSADVESGVLDVYCSPFPVKSYRAGGVPALNSDRSAFGIARRTAADRPQLPGHSKEHLSLCMDRERMKRPPPLKIVTRDSAASTFETVAEGMFFRFFGTERTTLASIIDPVNAPFRQGRKDCQQEFSRAEQDKLESHFGWGLSRGIFTFGQNAGRELARSLETIISADEYLRFSNYLAPYFRSGRLSAMDDGQLLSIVFVSNCDGRAIGTSKSMEIVHPIFVDSRMNLNVQELINLYTINNSPPEDADKPLHERRAPGLTRIGVGDLIRLGQFFRVNDVENYFVWRDVVDQYLREGALGLRMAELGNPDWSGAVYDFFTHLILAAAFSYPLEADPQTPLTEF